MKILSVLFYLAYATFTYSQSTIFGTYELKTSLQGDSTNGTILKLNCNHTYYRSDKISTDWGTWKLKGNEQFILSIDTMFANGRTEKHRVKVYYRILPEKLVLDEREYSKKEFKRFIKEIQKNNNHGFRIKYSEIGYEKYRRYSINLYFERKTFFNCQ